MVLSGSLLLIKVDIGIHRNRNILNTLGYMRMPNHLIKVIGLILIKQGINIDR